MSSKPMTIRLSRTETYFGISVWYYVEIPGEHAYLREVWFDRETKQFFNEYYPTSLPLS